MAGGELEPAEVDPVVHQSKVEQRLRTASRRHAIHRFAIHRFSTRRFELTAGGVPAEAGPRPEADPGPGVDQSGGGQRQGLGHEHRIVTGQQHGPLRLGQRSQPRADTRFCPRTAAFSPTRGRHGVSVSAARPGRGESGQARSTRRFAPLAGSDRRGDGRVTRQPLGTRTHPIRIRGWLRFC